MAEIRLGFGDDSVPFNFDESRFVVLGNQDRFDIPLSDVEINQAIESPIDSATIEEKLSPGDSVLIVVSDATRATASAEVVNLLVRRLIAGGIAPFDIRIIFATGIHRPVSAREKLELLTPFIAQRVRTIDHNPDDESVLVDLGRTKRGTPIRVNRALFEHTHVILTGAVGFHYFAGFTGGRKSISPGLASSETISSTHMLALDFERGGRRAGVAPGALDGNPIHEECMEIAERVSPSFLINSVVDDQGQPVRIYAGDWKAAHRQACADYASAHSVRIGARRKLVIASCGGLPYDINLIQAHKALDMAAIACEDGGTILLMAECRDGLGRPDFMKWFEPGGSAALERRLHVAYEVNGQTAWALLTKTERFNVILISRLPEENVRQLGMIPAASLDQALKQIPSDTEGFIMPRAGSVLPVVSA